MADDLRRYGYVQRAYLGVNVLEMTSDIARQMGLNEVKGVLVARVVPSSAADGAGLQGGDLLLSVAGVAVNSYAEMMEELARFNPGERVDITYYRDGRTYSATATLQNSKGTTELRVR